MVNSAAPSVPPWRITAALMLVVPLNQIPMDIYTPALPQMRHDLGASATALQTTVTVFMAGMALAYLAVGIMSDAWGRKPVVLGSAAALVMTSLACAAAESVGMLLVLRTIQGVACSAFLVVAIATAADCFEGARLRSVSGMMAMAWSAAPVLAPAVGGFVVEYLSWRWVFVVIAGLTAVVGTVIAWALPETLPAHKRERLHPRQAGRVLLETARNPVFMVLVSVFGLIAGAQLSFAVAAPFLYQSEMGFSPSGYGLIALVLGLAVLVGSLSTSVLATRVQFAQLVFADWSLFMIGSVLLLGSAAVVGVEPVVITIAAGLAVIGAGGLVPQAQGSALGLFERNLGLVGGLFGTLTYLIIAAAMAVTGVLPERTQVPIGGVFVVSGTVVFVLLIWVTKRLREVRPE